MIIRLYFSCAILFITEAYSMTYKNFITLEGGEASGKTTIIEEIIKYLAEKNLRYVKTREPGGDNISEQIRHVILDKENTDMDYRCEALLYAASRMQHLSKTVIPALNEEKIVICDRYVDSSLVYQGVARQLGIEEIRQINSFALKYMPGLTLFINIKPEVALKRIKDNNRDSNRLDVETMEFHQKVYQGYLMLTKLYPERIKIVDGNKELALIVMEVIKILDEYFRF